MDGDTFRQWKKQCLNKCDLSKKGSVDEDIAHVVSLINNQDRLFSTSSCSGRILLLDAVSDSPDVQKQNCSWLFVTHQKCQRDDLLTGLGKSTGDATFKFEPFVLHVQCKELKDAQLLHTAAINSGFRNSGITVGKKGKIIMAVRSTHCLEVPLGLRGHTLVSEEYMDFLLGVANQKMEENLRRIQRFYDCLQAALQPVQDRCSLRDEAEQMKPVYRRRRKHKGGHGNPFQTLEEHQNSEEDTDCDLLFPSQEL